MFQVGFEHEISASERPQTYALDRADIGMGPLIINYPNIFSIKL